MNDAVMGSWILDWDWWMRLAQAERRAGYGCKASEQDDDI